MVVKWEATRSKHQSIIETKRKNTKGKKRSAPNESMNSGSYFLSQNSAIEFCSFLYE